MLDLNIDIDPDIQFYNTQCNKALLSCDYYLEDSFNRKISELRVPDRCLSLIHTNIRSAVKNLKNFELYLGGLEFQFPIIALSESWLREDNLDKYGMIGYSSEHNIRKNRRGGGVSLLIKEDIEYTIRDDISNQNFVAETFPLRLTRLNLIKSKIA